MRPTSWSLDQAATGGTRWEATNENPGGPPQSRMARRDLLLAEEGKARTRPSRHWIRPARPDTRRPRRRYSPGPGRRNPLRHRAYPSQAALGTGGPSNLIAAVANRRQGGSAYVVTRAGDDRDHKRAGGAQRPASERGSWTASGTGVYFSPSALVRASFSLARDGLARSAGRGRAAPSSSDGANSACRCLLPPCFRLRS